jgi:hypothetical protein
LFTDIGTPFPSNHVKSIGYLDELQKEYDDPIAHFKQVAIDMTKKYQEDNQPIHIHACSGEQLELGTSNRMNLGYAAIVKIFHELGLAGFLRNKQRRRNFNYNTYSVMLLLVVSRLLSPASKKRTFENRGRYFEHFDFELLDVYRSLTYFARIDKQVQRHMHEQITALYGRDTKLVYYDVTNYYFEIDDNDPDEIDDNGNIIKKGSRKKGVNKEHRPNPIVQMGLAMDTDGIPIAYNMHPGNTNDVLTLRPMVKDLKLTYNLGRIVVVADKGINSGDNIWYLKTTPDRDGYVISMSIRGSSADFKKYEKQVIFYSRKYAEKAKADRVEAVAKARDLCANPAKYNHASSYGALKYVDDIDFDKKTGEILMDSGHRPVFNETKLLEEEKYDGYYAIVTGCSNFSCRAPSLGTQRSYLPVPKVAFNFST